MARSTGWIRTCRCIGWTPASWCRTAPCWSPDGRTFYFADTWSGEIWAYDCDPASGAISNRRTFTRVDMSGGGAADGSTVDAEGYLWNAQVYDGKLVRYAPDGSVDRVIRCRSRKSPA